MARGRPWLPRGGATALGGGATELMGDVVIFLLSERQTDKQTRETKIERKESKKRESRRRRRERRDGKRIEEEEEDRQKKIKGWWKKNRIRKEGRKEEQSVDGTLSLELQFCSRPPDVSVHTSVSDGGTF